VGVGAAAWSRGFAHGVWLEPWEIAVLLLGLALAFVRPRPGHAATGRGRRAGRR